MYIEDYGFKTEKEVREYIIDNQEDYLIPFKEKTILYFIVNLNIVEVIIKYENDIYSCNSFIIESININSISKEEYQLKYKKFLTEKIKEKELELNELRKKIELDSIEVFNGSEFIKRIN